MPKKLEPPPEDITFGTLTSFLDKLASRKPRKSSRRNAVPTDASDKPAEYFQNWVNSLKWPLRPKTGKIIFRLIFPELDVRRKYNLQETRLAKYLVHIFNVNTGRGQRGEALLRWNATTEDQHGIPVGKDGCLGLEVHNIRLNMDTEPPSSIKLAQLDRLLDELAAHSPWSSLGDVAFRKPPRPQTEILKDIYEPLSARESAYITQIILKDLRPLLYPLPSHSTYIALMDFNSAALSEMNQYSMMKAWHWAMPRIYRARADLDKAADACEQIPGGRQQLPSSGNLEEIVKRLTKPQLGTPVNIPKAIKASGPCLAAPLSRLKGPVWAETKMDGERMQIHIDTTKPENMQIQIFSKSHRDSTKERATTHIPIRAALGLHFSTPSAFLMSHPRLDTLKKIKSGIFEAEMVAWNMSEGKVDEFWRIAELKLKPWQSIERDDPNASSMEQSTGGLTESQMDAMNTQQLIDLQSRHLALCFFDVIYLNDESLLEFSYDKRRHILEECIHVIPHYTMLVERKLFDFDCEDARDALRHHYATVIAERHEGLVLKPAGSIYNDFRSEQKWYKVKKDYIDGLGDTADYAIIGASWDQDRGRELRVPTSTYTIWYIGLCDNPAAIQIDPSTRPNFQVVFTSASYGLSRSQLEKANRMAHESESQPPRIQARREWPFTYQLAQGLTKPAIIFKKPFVFELMGSGFTKRSRLHEYELRWPRITKLHDPEERDWHSAVDLPTHNDIAKKATYSRHLTVADEIFGGSRGKAENGFQAEIDGWHHRLRSSDVRWLTRASKLHPKTVTPSDPFADSDQFALSPSLSVHVPSESDKSQPSVSSLKQTALAQNCKEPAVPISIPWEATRGKVEAAIVPHSAEFAFEVDASTGWILAQPDKSSLPIKTASVPIPPSAQPSASVVTSSDALNCARSPAKQPRLSPSKRRTQDNLRRPRLVTFVKPGEINAEVTRRALELKHQKKSGTKRRKTVNSDEDLGQEDGEASIKRLKPSHSALCSNAPFDTSLIATSDQPYKTLSRQVSTSDAIIPSIDASANPSDAAKRALPREISPDGRLRRSPRRSPSAPIDFMRHPRPPSPVNARGTPEHNQPKVARCLITTKEVTRSSVNASTNDVISVSTGSQNGVCIGPSPVVHRESSDVTSLPPWRQGMNVRWCLVPDEDDHGISGTRYDSVTHLLRSIEINRKGFYYHPESAGVSYIFIQNPTRSNLQRIQKQIALRALSNPNVTIVGYDSKALEVQRGNPNTWNQFELFRFNSYNEEFTLQQLGFDQTKQSGNP